MPRPNVVLISADDIGFNEIGPYQGTGMPDRDVYGGERVMTPHMDAIASGGAKFTRYYTPSSICTPARYSILTGRFASRSPSIMEAFPPPAQAMIAWNTRIDRSEGTIGKAFKSSGYATGYVGKWHNHEPKTDLSHVAHITDPRDPDFAGAVGTAYRKQLDHLRDGMGFDYVDNVYFGNREGFPKPLRVHNLEWLSEGADRFIQDHKDEPFFLYMALSTPHGDHFGSFLDDDPLLTPEGPLDKPPETLMPPRKSIPERLRAAGISEKTAMSTWQDDCIGAVMARLEQLGLAENTIVAFTCDHLARGKNMCYEGSRVPFFIRWPGSIPPGRTIDRICSHIDLVPTLVELAGGSLPEDYLTDGASFARMLLGEDIPWRDHLLLECSNIRGVVTDRWKYIACRASEEVRDAIEADRLAAEAEGRKRYVSWEGRRNPHPQYVTEGVRFFDCGVFPHFFDPDQLYDLMNDPFEQTNVFGDPANAEVAAGMKELLKGSLERLPHSFAEFTPSRARHRRQS